MVMPSCRHCLSFERARSGTAPRRLQHLCINPAERIELAEQLWDSLEPESEGTVEALATDLRRRRAELRAAGDLGLEGNRTLDEIATRER